MGGPAPLSPDGDCSFLSLSWSAPGSARGKVSRRLGGTPFPFLQGPRISCSSHLLPSALDSALSCSL